MCSETNLTASSNQVERARQRKAERSHVSKQPHPQGVFPWLWVGREMTGSMRFEERILKF